MLCIFNYFYGKTLSGDCMIIRTDLAVERREMTPEEDLGGVKIDVKENAQCRATIIDIEDGNGQRVMGKPVGRYITLEMQSFPDSSVICDGRLDMLTDTLCGLIPEKGTVLVVGLGNPDITPDAVGPLCADKILATRHISKETEKQLQLPSLREVAVISAGVMGKTGIEAGEIIAGVKEKIKPSCIIAVDALAARSVTRLGTTVQISDTGIEPGSGVGNRRQAIDEKSLGVPVIAIGIPTVVDAATLTLDLTGQEPQDEKYANMMVTPKDTDIISSSGARLIALAINCALQKNLTREEIISLTMP